AKDPGSSIFDSCREVYGQLGAMGFKEVVLTGSERFASSKTLALVERNLFAGRPVIATAGTDAGLAVIEAVNIEDEVEQMARRIYKMVGPLRFCDIGIILRDVGPYYDLMETVFARYGIPLRLYVKRPLNESPLVKTIMNLFRIFAADWRDDTRVLEVIKSHYVKSPRNGPPSNGPGLPAQEVDRFEREALKRGLLTGRDSWLKLAGEGQWPGIQGFLGKMAELEKGVSDPKGAGAFREWFLTVIDECIVIPGATDPSCGELVKIEARALRSFLSVLDSLPRILGDGRISFNNFVEELSGAVSASSYALKDKRQDVVNVIDALEARQWELPVVFVGGLLERQFPRQARENLFMSDRDRRQLNDLSGVNLKEHLKNSAEEERFLFYIALTRARERLVLSYPAMDSRGSPNIPSFFLREVKKLFSAESFSNIFIKRIPSDIIPAAGDVVTQKDRRNFVCYYLNTPYRKGSDKETLHVLSRMTYNGLRTEDTGLIEDLKVALGTPEMGDIGGHRGVIGEIFPSFRATQFSDFAQCPFLHFARHILRLKALRSLAEDGLSPLLQGDIIHETLRRYCEGKAADISNVFKGVFAGKTRGLRLGLGELQVRDAMLQALRSFVEKDRQYEDLLPLRPEYIEKSFGGSGEPALEIHDTQGMGPDTIRIRGRIDRVDVAEVDGERIGLVLDYKYVRYADGGLTKSKFKEIEEEGVDLQLPIYLMAAREFLDVTPVGAQLYTLKPPPERSGILELRVKQLAPSLTVKGMPFIEERDMEAFLEHSRDHIRRQAGGIMSGCKDILPRDVQRCEEGRCEFLDVCRFEKWSAGKKGK
ncbi:MAG: PD-(D/E)XK nuclease family protein, partial [Candidatus Brocadiales bacterium]